MGSAHSAGLDFFKRLCYHESMKLEDVDIRGVVLTTDRLILRPFEEGDLNDLYDYAKVDGVGECAGWKHHESIEESKKILDMFITGHRTFAIVFDGKVIGSVGIEKTGESEYGKEITDKNVNEVGYVLSKDYWGHGLMTEAVKAVIEYMFDGLGCEIVTCGHFTHNDRSRRVIEKCKFKFYGKSEYTTRYGAKFESKNYILRDKGDL